MIYDALAKTVREHLDYAIAKRLAEVARKAKARGQKVLVMFDQGIGVPYIGSGEFVQFVIPGKAYRPWDAKVGRPVHQSPWAIDAYDQTDAKRIADVLDAHPHCMLFDPFLHAMHGSFLQPQIENGVCHSQSFFNFERKRLAGKAAFDALNIAQPIYTHVFKGSRRDVVDLQISTLAAQSGCRKIAVKYNKGHFIGIYPKYAIDHVWKAAQTDDVIIEEYLGDANQELNVCYVAVNGKARPVLLLQETNRLIPNGTGGKTGMVMAKHMAYNPDLFPGLPGELDLSVLNEMVGHMVDFKVNGWFDISYMRAPNGQWLATEWCTRHGVSNWCTTSRMFARPYAEIMFDLREGREPDLTLKYTHASSVELFVLNLPASSTVDAKYSGRLWQQWEAANRSGEIGQRLFFDPLVVRTSDDYGKRSGWHLDPWHYNQYVTRMGVLSKLGVNGTVDRDLQNALREWAADVPNVAYRDDLDTLDMLY